MQCSPFYIPPDRCYLYLTVSAIIVLQLQSTPDVRVTIDMYLTKHKTGLIFYGIFYGGFLQSSIKQVSMYSLSRYNISLIVA